MTFKIPAAESRLVAALSRRAGELGVPLYLAGGAVRDWMLGRRTCDLDFVVEGDARLLAEEAAKIMDGKAESFDRFGTFRVKGSGPWRIDLAAARRESYPEPAALPVVERPAPIAEDLRRRDFTINAMAYRLSPGPRILVDPFGGAEDLKAGVIRVLHDLSFRDDPTRVFRAARYGGRFDFAPAAGLPALARAALKDGHAKLLSPHRLTQEFLRILAEPAPAIALRRLQSWGYLGVVSPVLGGVSRWPDWQAGSAEQRLAQLCVTLGPDLARELLSALPIHHHVHGDIVRALAVLEQKASPRDELPPLAAGALSRVKPRLAPSALKPAFLRGADLQALGLKPGPAFHEIINEAARLQWRGRLPTRREALVWLERHVAPAKK